MNQGQRARGNTFLIRVAGICFVVVFLIRLAGPLFFGDKWTTGSVLEIVFIAGIAAFYLWRGFASAKP